MAKDSGIRIRVEGQLRRLFVETCRQNGQKASDVLRDFMKEYVEFDARARQGVLFNSNDYRADENNT